MIARGLKSYHSCRFFLGTATLFGRSSTCYSTIANSRTQRPPSTFPAYVGMSLSIGNSRFSSSYNGHPVNKSINMNAKNMKDIMANYDTLFLDCDGVLWGCDHFTKFSGISEAVDKLRAANKQMYFVTNNSLHAREAYLEKFKSFGGFEAEKDHVFGVAYAAALYLKDIAKIQGKCYLVGSKGMARELEEVGIPFIGYGPDNDKCSIRPDDLMAMHMEPDVDAVLVGFDEYFNYNKMCKAASYLSNPKCHYIATNYAEKAIQLSRDLRQPLTGALVSAITTSTSRAPLVLGKPHEHLLECIQTKFKDIDLKRTLMIGDSVKTDVGFAETIGVDSLLVMSGATTEAHLQKCQQMQKTVPTYYMDSFASFGKNS